jgi:hypothetical protein
VATQPEDDEPLELTEEMELNPDDESEEQREDEPDPSANDEADEQTVVAFEGEEPEKEPDSSTIREMRQRLREKDRELSELRKASTPKAIDVGEKPTLAGCEFDEERFETELDAWKDRKAAADRQQQSQAEQSRAANEAWQQDLNTFEQKKAALEFDDAADAIESATLALDMVQQAVIVKSAQDPALFLYALSKSPAKAAELAKIQDPIKLAAAVARMEGAVKVTKTRKAPAPDRPLSGSGKLPEGADKKLEQLERESDRTRDMTKLIAYKREKGLLK